MRQARRGAVVNVASIGGLTGWVAGTAYVTSKHAVIGLTRSIAALYADDGLRCNAVCPGGVETNIAATATPTVDWAYRRLQRSFAKSGPPAQPDQIAALISWLASDEASNVNGAVVTADGGFMA
jgi:NAD(P)-dependent dehydrogenase (short-subunit alcohol dehydrogenase family)